MAPPFGILALFAIFALVALQVTRLIGLYGIQRCALLALIAVANGSYSCLFYLPCISLGWHLARHTAFHACTFVLFIALSLPLMRERIRQHFYAHQLIQVQPASQQHLVLFSSLLVIQLGVAFSGMHSSDMLYACHSIAVSFSLHLFALVLLFMSLYIQVRSFLVLRINSVADSLIYLIFTVASQ